MYQPYKCRLYPFKNHERELQRQLDEFKHLRNYALGQRRDMWRQERKSFSYVEQCRSLTRWWNHDADGIGRLRSQVAQECLARLKDAFTAFFEHRAKYPHFRSEVTSLCYPQAFNGSVDIIAGRGGTKRPHFARLGNLPIALDRHPPEGRLKTCTVEREGDHWFAILAIEVPDPAPPPTIPPENPVGIGVGLTTLATYPTGEKVEPPKFLRKAEKRRKWLDREVARKKKGSHNWEKAKIRCARFHAKVRDQRRDFAHKLTTVWADRFDLIAYEDMGLSPHVPGAFSKSTANAGWGLLCQYSEYKRRNRSQRFVGAPRKDMIQTRHPCGKLAVPHLELSDREIWTTACGQVMDRDINTAKNVVARALALVRRRTLESTPAEIGLPPSRKGRQIRLTKQEPPAVIGVAT
jgi:putative transposase